MTSDPGSTAKIGAAAVGQRDAVGTRWRRTALTTSYNDPGTDFDIAIGRPNSDVPVAIVNDEVVATVLVGHDGHRSWLSYVAVTPTARARAWGGGSWRLARSGSGVAVFPGFS